MVVKPTDIMNWEGVGKTLEEEIDRTLKKMWKGKNCVKFDLPPNLPERITGELISRYRKAGWLVEHKQGDCQRDGAWNYLEFREAQRGM